MVNRLPAYAIIFGISVVNTECRFESQAIHSTIRRISFRHRDSLSSSNLSTRSAILDASEWLAQEQATEIRINNDALQPEGGYGASSWKTIMASVRTRRRPSFQKTQNEEEEDEKIIAPNEAMDPAILKSVTQPFVPKSVWSQLQGNEYDQPGVIDDLVETALSLTKSEDSEWIKWKSQNGNNDETNEEDVRVYVGRCQKSDISEYYGANLPVIKTEARLQITPKDMADLLLDSSRVRIYNKMSMGRKDIRIIDCDKGVAKIVKNVTKPPLTSKKIESVTFMHSRLLDEKGTYIVVSRAVTLPSTATTGEEKDRDVEEFGKSEILLGVNLLEPCDDNSSKMTSITHVYAPALPTLVAKRVGVNSATNFVHDIRSICKDTKESED